MFNILAFAAGLLLLYVFCRLFALPLKLLFKLLLNAAIGAVILIFVNFVGGAFGLNIDINPATALATGIFGAPGVIVLAILSFVF